MSLPSRQELTQELETQLNDYWFEVDFNWGRNAHKFYTLDGVFEASSGRKYEGRDTIADFYNYRLDRGARTAVHLVSNFRATLHDASNATSTWYLSLYASDGETPHPSAPPILISSMTDSHKRQADGSWLCSYRLFDTLFKGGIPTTSMPADYKKKV